MAQNIPPKQKLNGKHFGQNSVWGVGEGIAILSDASHVKIEQQYVPDSIGSVMYWSDLGFP